MEKETKEARNWAGVWFLLYTMSVMQMGGAAFGMSLFGYDNKYGVMFVFWVAAMVSLYMLIRFANIYIEGSVVKSGRRTDGRGTKLVN